MTCVTRYTTYNYLNELQNEKTRAREETPQGRLRPVR